MAPTEVTARILRRLLASGVTSPAERLLARVHPADLGPLFSDLTPEEIRRVVDLLFRQHRAANTLRELPPELLPHVFEALSDERLASVFGRLQIDDMIELADQLDAERHERILTLLPPHKREELRKHELYPEDSAGRVMTTSFLGVDEKMTAQEAIEHIRSFAEDNDAVLYVYVIDGEGRLQGTVPIRRLVASRPDRPCGEFMIREAISARIDADQEEVAQLVARYNLLAIPVTDADDKLLGVITVDDVIEVITEEATEDIYNLAGLSDEDRVFSPARTSVRKRLPWSMLNLGAVFLAASVVGLFEQTLDRIVTLAVFMPVINGMGGNGGVQALTVVTRAMALGEIEFSSGLRAVGKELVVGLTIGLVAGAIAGVLAWMWQGNPWIGLVLALAMVITMATAGLLGAAVPVLLKALRQDPALGSGVVVVTITDTFGLFCFLGLGTLLIDRIS
jgi:magnesium transporter